MNNNTNNNTSSVSQSSGQLIDDNTEILSNSYSYDLHGNFESDLPNSKFYLSSNSRLQTQNSSQDPAAVSESRNSLKNQSRSCQNLSNLTVNPYKPPNNTQKSASNFIISKFKGIKKGVEKLYNNHSKKRTDATRNDVISSSNKSLNSPHPHSKGTPKIEGLDINDSENHLFNGILTDPTTPYTNDRDYQHQQSISSELNAQTLGKSRSFTDEETDDSESGKSAQSYKIKSPNGENNPTMVSFAQSRSLQESTNKKHQISSTNSSSVQIINSKYIQPSNYLDKQDHIELNKKLAMISISDHIWLQKKGFELLLQQAEAKRAEIVSLKADIEELNKSLVDKKEPVRSQFEIETLRGEIRELTNDKWKLEKEINIRCNKWECKKCTFRNNGELVQCEICSQEKDDNEIFICLHCETKNPLANISCKKCNAYFAAESNNDLYAVNDTNQRERRSSSNVSTNSNHSSQNINSPSTPSSRKLTHNSSMSSSSSLNSAFPQSSPVFSLPFSTTYTQHHNIQQHPSIPFVATGSNSTHSGMGYTPLVQSNQNLPPRSPRMHLNLANSHQNYNGISANENVVTSLPPPYSRNNGHPISHNHTSPNKN